MKTKYSFKVYERCYTSIYAGRKQYDGETQLHLASIRAQQTVSE